MDALDAEAVEALFGEGLAKARASLEAKGLELGRLIRASRAAVFEAVQRDGPSAGETVPSCVAKIFRGASAAREIAILRSMPLHPNIPSIVEACACENYLVLSPRGECDLYDLVFGGRAERDAARAALHGALQGLAHVHRCGVVHRDVKPENVVLVRRCLGVLIDFDSAERSGTVSGRAGTRRYMAPEVARSARLLVEPSQDFWSAGRLLEDLIPADASLSRFSRRARGMQRHLPQLRDGVEALIADMSAR